LETDLKLTKKAQNQISSHINALMCYHGMVATYNEKNETTRAIKSMVYFNEAADALIAMGIEVNRYNLEGMSINEQ
jgi:hypothetical protein